MREALKDLLENVPLFLAIGVIGVITYAALAIVAVLRACCCGG